VIAPGMETNAATAFAVMALGSVIVTGWRRARAANLAWKGWICGFWARAGFCTFFLYGLYSDQGIDRGLGDRAQGIGRLNDRSL